MNKFFCGQKIKNIRDNRIGIVLDIHELCGFIKVSIENNDRTEWWQLDEWAPMEEENV